MSEIRHTFYETGDKLTIVLYVKNTDKSKTRVTLTDNSQLTVCMFVGEEKLEKTFHLGRPVQAWVEEIDANILEHSVGGNPFKVEVFLKKLDVHGNSDSTVWGSLEKPEGVFQSISSASASKTDVHASDRWQSLDTEDDSGSIEDVFKKIYASGDENVRRAMMKSFQTSNGTVLSTNWKDVENADYSQNK